MAEPRAFHERGSFRIALAVRVRQGRVLAEPATGDMVLWAWRRKSHAWGVGAFSRALLSGDMAAFAPAGVTVTLCGKRSPGEASNPLTHPATRRGFDDQLVQLAAQDIRRKLASLAETTGPTAKRVGPD